MPEIERVVGGKFAIEYHSPAEVRVDNVISGFAMGGVPTEACGPAAETLLSQIAGR